MSYVPGYESDVFISYAHGDDRGWITRLVERLKPELKRRLGTEPVIWMDTDDLRSSRDFRKEIPSTVKSSAIFVLLCSPTYVRSDYCVREECRAYAETIALKRVRFSSEEFANEQFAIRVLLLPVENNEHWLLFSGLTDISFCDLGETLSPGSRQFKTSFRRLAGELILLLKRMRNHSTPVFLFHSGPNEIVRKAHKQLSAELSAQTYRLLPDRLVNLATQLQEASASVFLIGDIYDQTLDDLTRIAHQCGKPWVVWCSPESRDARPGQIGFLRHLQNLDSPTKTFLDATTVSPNELKNEVLTLLESAKLLSRQPSDKRRVSIIYDSRDSREKGNVGQIVYHYRNQFEFDLPEDPAERISHLESADGVLLVWGNSEEEWCALEFESMLHISRMARSKGLCLFDPQASKTDALRRLRNSVAGVHVIEQFGRFDPSRLESFFRPLRHPMQDAVS